MRSKFIKGLFALLIAFGIGWQLEQQTVQAATWHKGTPTAIRGKFRNPKVEVSSHSFAARIYIKKATFELTSWHSATEYYKSMSYKHLSKHVYLLKGNEFGWGYIKVVTGRYPHKGAHYRRSSISITITNAKATKSYQKIGWFYKY